MDGGLAVIGSWFCGRSGLGHGRRREYSFDGHALSGGTATARNEPLRRDRDYRRQSGQVKIKRQKLSLVVLPIRHRFRPDVRATPAPSGAGKGPAPARTRWCEVSDLGTIRRYRGRTEGTTWRKPPGSAHVGNDSAFSTSVQRSDRRGSPARLGRASRRHATIEPSSQSISRKQLLDDVVLGAVRLLDHQLA